MAQSKYKEPVDLVGTAYGVVTVIHPDTGMVTEYGAKGLRRYSKEHVGEYHKLVAADFINPNAVNLPELPNGWDCSFERPEIMGKAMLRIGDYVTVAKRAGIL